MIQIRQVPDDLHRRLKVRAAQMGVSLSDYLKQELTHIAQTPTLDEIFERISRRQRVELSESIEEIVRADRESH